MAAGFKLFPHDWHSTEYVSEWIARDVTRDDERRPLLRQMLASAGLPHDAAPDVLDVGAGYGAVTEEVLRAFSTSVSAQCSCTRPHGSAQ